MKLSHLFSIVLVCVAGGMLAGATEPIPLWPHGAPGDKGSLGPESDTTKETDHQVAGRRVVRLGNVSEPAITVFAPKNNNTGTAVLVCPGGGYHILAMDLEGTEVIDWLNSVGVTGVLLKYRVPVRPGRERYEAPLQDAQRAMGLVRARSAELGIKHLGVLGFSAGGHLAAVLSGHDDARTYEKIDAADELGSRPDFAVLIYPAYLTIKEQEDRLAPEMNVTAATPPTFLVQTEDDAVRVESSLFYYLALKQARAPAELHLFATGGHGYGMRHTDQAVSDWPKLAERWMRGQHLLSSE